MAGERLGQLVAAHIQGARRHRPAVEPFDELAQRAILLLLIGQAVAVHEHELGAQQPDALGAGLQRHAELARQLEIGIERDLGAVAGHRREAAQPRQRAQVALMDALAAVVLGNRLRRGAHDDAALIAVDDQRIAVLDHAQQPGDAEDRRQAEGAGHDGGMALRAAEEGGKAGDRGGIHQRGIGGRQILGDDDRAFRQMGEGGEGCLGQVADQPVADLADVIGTGRDIGIVEGGEFLGDGGDLRLHRGFRIDAVARDAILHPAQHAAAREHLQMRLEQDGDLLGRRPMQPRGLGFELADLLPRRGHGLGEARLLGLDLVGLDLELGHMDGAGFDEMGLPHGDAGGDAHAFEDPLLAGTGAALSLHRICVRSDRGRRPARPRPEARLRSPRHRCRRRRRASSAP